MQTAPLSLLSRKHLRYLAFGWVLAGFSTIGTGFFVGLFNPHLRQAFDLTNTELSLIFTITTLASAPLMLWLGALIDKMDLGHYFALVGAGLATGCVLIGASTTVLTLTAGILLVRLMGDWLLPHVAITSFLRYFNMNRGKVTGMLAVGYGLGPATLPVLAVGVVAAIGWRETWFAFAAATIIIVVPACMLLLGNRMDNLDFRRPTAVEGLVPISGRAIWQLLADKRFLAAALVAICSPLTIAGLFFHQAALVEQRGWSLSWYAASFSAFAACQIISMVLMGALADRLGALRIMPLYPLSLTIGIGALLVSDHQVTAVIYLGGAGFATGMYLVVVAVVWAELYGSANVGTIRALVQAIVLVIVAGTTVGTGMLLDVGVRFDTIAGVHAIVAALTLVPALYLRRAFPKQSD